MQEVHADAVVIGAGAGGLSAAARLAHAGFNPILVEALDHVGGRAATEEIEGFKVNIGAIALELGGVFEETFRLVGAPLDVRMPEPASAFYLDGKVVDISRGGWGLLLGQITKQASRVLEKIADARAGNLPDGRQSTAEWLAGYTSNKTVHAIFRNLCAAIFACNADELPARAFLTYFTSKGAFKRFGFSPTGTMGAWNALARATEAHGAQVWLSSPVTGISVAEGAVRGVTVTRDGVPTRIVSDLVVSDAGPAATVALAGEAHFPAAYVDQVRTVLRPAANIVINFATREPLFPAPGIITFGKTRRLCNMANMTATCPELAPPGWHLYVAYAVPVPALGDFDETAEVEEALADLREIFPGFAGAKMLSIRVMRDGWPAQRSCAGYDLPRETGVGGLWCVGDAVKVYGNGGTQACAETAKLVVDAIVAARGARPSPARRTA
ncbi:phytoene desaturase family protein [Chelatococcus reniformis]|uniref:Amine oxidase n=1 Tax=Chelatococcus reniformis TaxID=1494448 RepID=A0A916UIX0_9HYPH|nr:FAD-dependent oxidoreductase [Chelatococcus reniformis]GGC74769.1 amine oxidase [Chelatococcus reniformis]